MFRDDMAGFDITGLLSARSDKILPPVRSISRQTSLTSLQTRAEPTETDRLKSYISQVRVARREGPNISGISLYMTRDPPDGGSNAQVDLSL